MLANVLHERFACKGKRDREIHDIDKYIGQRRTQKMKSEYTKDTRLENL